MGRVHDASRCLGRDAAGRPDVFTVDRYFERAAWPDRITRKFRAPVIRRHRTLEDYMTGAIAAGFVLRELREAEPTQEEQRMSTRFAKIARIPYFLFLRWARGWQAAEKGKRLRGQVPSSLRRSVVSSRAIT